MNPNEWVTHGMMQAMWVTHGMMTVMCQAHRKEVDESEWGERRNLLLVFAGGEKQSKERKEGEKQREERKEREGDEGKKPTVLPLISNIQTVRTHQIRK